MGMSVTERLVKLEEQIKGLSKGIEDMRTERTELHRNDADDQTKLDQRLDRLDNRLGQIEKKVWIATGLLIAIEFAIKLLVK